MTSNLYVLVYNQSDNDALKGYYPYGTEAEIGKAYDALGGAANSGVAVYQVLAPVSAFANAPQSFADRLAKIDQQAQRVGAQLSDQNVPLSARIGNVARGLGLPDNSQDWFAKADAAAARVVNAAGTAYGQVAAGVEEVSKVAQSPNAGEKLSGFAKGLFGSARAKLAQLAEAPKKPEGLKTADGARFVSFEWLLTPGNAQQIKTGVDALRRPTGGSPQAPAA